MIQLEALVDVVGNWHLECTLKIRITRLVDELTVGWQRDPFSTVCTITAPSYLETPSTNTNTSFLQLPAGFMRTERTHDFAFIVHLLPGTFLPFST